MTLRQKIFKYLPDDYFLKTELQRSGVMLLPCLIVEKKSENILLLKWRLDKSRKIPHNKYQIDCVFKRFPDKKRVFLKWDEEYDFI